MSAVLEDMRAIVREQHEAKAASAAASAERAEMERRQEYAEACEKLRRFIPASLLDGRWTIHDRMQGYTSRMTSGHEAELMLVSEFLAEPTPQLVILARWCWINSRTTEVLHIQRPGISSTVYIREGSSTDEVMSELAPIVVGYVQDDEADRAWRERDAARRAGEQMRQARINGKLAEMDSLYSQAITLDLDRIEAAWGWPEGRTLTVYQLEWVEGMDDQGNVSKDRTWVVSADPDAAGFYDVFLRAGPVKRRIVSPTMVTTMHVWRSIDDVPHSLTETVRRDRCLRVYECQGDGRLQWVGEKWVGGSRRVPGPALRTLLGYAVTEIPPDPLPKSPVSHVPLVPTLMTADGFEAIEPEVAEPSDDGERGY